MTGITPITNRNSSELVAEQIKELVLNKQYAAGEKIPTEEELTKLFAVGRGTIREAIKRLQAEGILTASPGKGTFVSPDALSCIQLSRFSKMVITMDQVQDLVELRLALEPEMAKLAAMRRTDKDIRAMQTCIDAMEDSDQKEHLLRCGHDFHRAVCKSTHNNMMEALHYSISNQLLKLRQMDFLTIDVYRRDLLVHQSILDAIVSQDARDAEEKMRAHIMMDYVSPDPLALSEEPGQKQPL